LEKYKSLSEAVKRERQIKSWKDRNAIENLIKKV
jgi:predicted GIY-YIG superfamily endonuclease